MQSEAISKTLVIAAEGALKQRVYTEYLKPLECINPTEDYYNEIRYFIESVKQDSMDEETYQRFGRFLSQFDCRDVILGCTEFPILIDSIRNSRYSEVIADYCFRDPLELTIQKLKSIMK